MALGSPNCSSVTVFARSMSGPRLFLRTMATKQKILKHNASQPGIILQPVAKTVWPSPRTTGDSRVGPAGPTSVYMIQQCGDIERDRLDEQFWYYKAHHRRNLVYNPNVSISSNGVVLDSATGSG
ncbi:hypothetical protein WG66_015939 [Moniliophthora roreri]|nr:hypothetical protein WG66_015939 [Moniliophthora roreri]